MKTITYSLLIILISFMTSCNEDDPIKHRELRIKRILTYNVITNEVPYRIQEYQYDSYNRLEKITEGDMIYDTFHYKDNLLEYKKTYHYANDSLGWLLVDSISYQYKNGELISEKSGSTIIKYIYDNSKLIRKNTYGGQIFDSSILYEYSGDLCTKETYFSDSLDLHIGKETVHHYEMKKLSLSESFFSNGTKYQIINYTYDDKGNLLIEEAVGLWELPGRIDYVKRYEYE